MGREARNNPTAIAAKEGKLPPKPKKPSKRERDRQITSLVITELLHPGTIRRLTENLRKGWSENEE